MTRCSRGQPQDAAAAYAEARRQVKGDPVRIASIIEKEVRVDQRLRRFSESLRRISLGLRGLDGRTDPAAHVSRSLLARRYAFSRFNQGRVDDALHWADIADQEAEDAVDKVTLALAYTTQSFIYATSGRDEPYPYGQLALQVYIELDQLRTGPLPEQSRRPSVRRRPMGRGPGEVPARG